MSVALRPGYSLAEAIRKGAAQHPQCAGTFFVRHPLDGITATCVMGAALVGLFGEAASTPDLQDLLEWYPELVAHRVPVCPSGDVCPDFLVGPYSGDPGSKPLYATLAHLNDRHHWTREALADWLEAPS